jgi:hypothetical protein
MLVVPTVAIQEFFGTLLVLPVTGTEHRFVFRVLTVP